MDVPRREDPPGSLRPRDPESEGGVSLPMAAMAEALRAHAEALQRIDRNQREIAESMAKGDRAQNVITSTSALNETFRGLTEVQRGLLDAVVSGGRRGRGGMPLALLAVAVLAALLGFLLFDRLQSDRTVSREIYESARADATRVQQELSRVQAQAGVARDEGRDTSGRLAESEAALTRERATAEKHAARIRELEADLKTMEGRVANYLGVKELADQAGLMQVSNMKLEQENRDLRERYERAERERERLLNLMAERKRDAMGGDREAILDEARARGVIPPEKPAPLPGGVVPLDGRAAKRLLAPINRLLDTGADETFVIVGASGIRDGTVLTEVRVAGYRQAAMVNSLQAKELEILIDPGQGTIELRLSEGALVATAHPAEQIPFDEGGHSIFLRDVPVAEWLRRVASTFAVGDDGRLTWKRRPS